MKVERKEEEVFEPITITLETENEVDFMETISLICTHETLNECCVRTKKDVDKVSNFGIQLAKKLTKLMNC